MDIAFEDTEINSYALAFDWIIGELHIDHTKSTDVLKDRQALELVCEALENQDRYKWHSLRKNPADVPKANGTYLGAFKHLVGDGYYYEIIHYGTSMYDPKGKAVFYVLDSEVGDVSRTDVVAWMEIPEFKEEE